MRSRKHRDKKVQGDPRTHTGETPLERITRFEMQYSGIIYAFASRMGMVDEAEDVVQETLLKAWRFFGHGTVGSSPGEELAWLRQTVYSVVRDMRRKRDRQRRAAERVKENKKSAEADNDPTVSKAIRKEDLNTLQKSLTELNPELCNAFLRYVVEGQSDTACAQQMGVSRHTNRNRRDRALNILRKEMNVLEDMPPLRKTSKKPCK